MRKKRRALLTLLAVVTVVALLLTGAAEKKTEYSGKEIYANSGGAVFYLRALNAEGGLKASGSGFLISKEGLALTAAHTIKSASSVNVVLPSGEELVSVEVLYRDSTSDVAVLRLPAREGGYDCLTLAEDTPAVGEGLYTIGYPLKTVKVMTEGTVSSAGSPINGIPRMLFTNNLASGMSGGPVISAYGEVVGIVSASITTMNGMSCSPTLAQIQAAVRGINTSTSTSTGTDNP